MQTVQRVIGTKKCGQRLGSFEELGRCNGIVFLLVDWYVSEGDFECVEECSSIWV
jgi:hypothetical protein